jgi:Pentapeptide repeats (8 copies)
VTARDESGFTEDSSPSGIKPLWRKWPVLGAIVVVALSLVWFLPLLMYRHTGTDAATTLKAVTDTRTALVAGLAGVAALWSVSYTARSFDLNRRALEVNRRAQTAAEAAQLESHRLEREAQLTGLYTTAVELLGSENLDMRHGGIYALERIAKESAADQLAVVEVLSAFVRRHSREKFHEDQAKAPPAQTPSDPPGPSTDVQAALTVLGRLPSRQGMIRARLRRAHLEHSWLPDANLERSDMTSGAHLDHANLRNAQFASADLVGTYFDGADLTGANFNAADLSGAHFPKAVMRGVSFEGANLSFAHLSLARGLNQQQIDSAIVDDMTELPSDL